MVDETIPRRDFLKGAMVGTAVLAAGNPAPAAAQTPAAAASAAADAEPLLTLTATEHAFVVAAVDAIIPADELSPSGSACGVATFVDRQLAGAYGMGAPNNVTVFFEDKIINPFMAAGASFGMNIDDFNGDNFDHSGLGFFGGAWISAGTSNGRPIQTRPVPPGTPRWGRDWKKATAKWYN